MAIYGYSGDQWKAARKEATKILRRCAKEDGPISYSSLAGQITAAHFEAHSTAFWALLGDISTREFEKGRGMLSVLVVHKSGDQMPGKDFFKLARRLGVSGDDEEIWIGQFNYVQDYWQGQ